MSDSNLKLHYHLAELWALIGVTMIAYLSFFQGITLSLSGPQLLLILLISLGFGFGHSLFLNSYYVRVLDKLIEFQQTKTHLDLTELHSLRLKLFKLPLKRALWIFERFLISGL